MANGWTPQRRARQSKLIHKWKPWRLAGVKSQEGKARSKMNAYKYGGYTKEMRDISRFIAACGRSFFGIAKV
jgi:hypothetical protein